jgi:hypothetical protein
MIRDKLIHDASDSLYGLPETIKESLAKSLHISFYNSFRVTTNTTLKYGKTL